MFVSSAGHFTANPFFSLQPCVIFDMNKIGLLFIQPNNILQLKNGNFSLLQRVCKERNRKCIK